MFPDLASFYLVSVTQTQIEAAKTQSEAKDGSPIRVWGNAIEKSPSSVAILVTQTPLRQSSLKIIRTIFSIYEGFWQNLFEIYLYLSYIIKEICYFRYDNEQTTELIFPGCIWMDAILPRRIFYGIAPDPYSRSDNGSG